MPGFGILRGGAGRRRSVSCGGIAIAAEMDVSGARSMIGLDPHDPAIGWPFPLDRAELKLASSPDIVQTSLFPHTGEIF
ncbi:hypothetical protein JHL17_20650 [Azospirillum sp. YIM B02556]|uniref:Uncharacterized protein n=1 Tax=Azospirillum endophyticum TaxID=2800326 RepID=A0ABS1F8T4_9PROT|nr:hypothetical protein [Azospirillum endophyticum]MBK1839821.1 hypothetical protein [Azospirillum endophyticum]